MGNLVREDREGNEAAVLEPQKLLSCLLAAGLGAVGIEQWVPGRFAKLDAWIWQYKALSHNVPVLPAVDELQGLGMACNQNKQTKI